MKGRINVSVCHLTQEGYIINSTKIGYTKNKRIVYHPGTKDYTEARQRLEEGYIRNR